MKRHRRAWTNSEVNRIKALSNAGYTITRIAMTTGRTPKAVANALHKASLPQKGTFRTPQRPEHITAKHDTLEWAVQSRQSSQYFTEAARKYYPQRETPPDSHGHYAKPKTFDNIRCIPKRINASLGSSRSSLIDGGNVRSSNRRYVSDYD